MSEFILFMLLENFHSQPSLLCGKHEPLQLLPEGFQPVALVIDVSKDNFMQKELFFLLGKTRLRV